MLDTLDSWHCVPDRLRSAAPLPAPWEAVFGPLRRGCVDDLVVVAQVGQSLDGRTATENGSSRYINGQHGLAHLHRLRAIVDAVIVGVGTVVADDPQLTVRHVLGPHPARVVIDPKGRMPEQSKLLADDGNPVLLMTTEQNRARMPAHVEAIALPSENGRVAPADVLRSLAARGLKRIMIEGGANTISCFLDAGCLDRLHVVVAPVILGSGRPGLALPVIDDVGKALRPDMRIHPLGDEVLFDCDLSAQRVPVGVAKKSM